jgi:cytochrome c oxidase subunit 2
LGNQWYWTYEYPEAGIKFDSNMIPDDKIQPGQLRLLEVDNRVVVPVGKVVRVQTTAADVNHAWAVPSFGVKKDAIPGKLNETWFRADKEGVYYGQCSELCGVRHGFMPIAVEVVAQEKYDAWLVEAKKKFAN